MFTEADTYAAFHLYQLRDAELRAEAERRRILVNAARASRDRPGTSPDRARWWVRLSRTGRRRLTGRHRHPAADTRAPALP